MKQGALRSVCKICNGNEPGEDVRHNSTELSRKLKIQSAMNNQNETGLEGFSS